MSEKFCKDCKYIKLTHPCRDNYEFTKCTFGINPSVRSLVSGELIEPEYPYCSIERASTDIERCGAEGRHFE